MTKKDFIALADAIREHNRVAITSGNMMLTPFRDDQLDTLAAFCKSQNHAFLTGRWTAYIAGECGQNGGAIQKAKARRG